MVLHKLSPILGMQHAYKDGTGCSIRVGCTYGKKDISSFYVLSAGVTMVNTLCIGPQVPERGTQVYIAVAHHAMRGEAANVFMSGLPVGRHV